MISGVEAGEQAEWESTLLGADYLFALFDGINRFYVRSEDRDLLPRLASAANCLDEFIPYPYHRQIENLAQSLLVASEGSPRAIRLASRACVVGRMIPGLTRLTRRISRAA